MPLLLLPGARAAQRFADLLDGTGAGAADPQLTALADLAGRLSSLPTPSRPWAVSGAARAGVLDRVRPPSDGGGPSGTGPGGTGPGGPGPGGSRPPSSPPRPAPGSGTGAATTADTTSAGTGAPPAGTAAVGTSTGVGTLAPLGPAMLHLAVAAVAAVVATSSGLAGAAAAAPGQLLYPAKTGLEQLRVQLAAGTSERAAAYLDVARARLDEIEQLTSLPDGMGVEGQRQAAALLTAWTGAVRPAVALLSPVGAGLHARHELTAFVANEAPRLAALRPLLPSAALRAQLVSSMGALPSTVTSTPAAPRSPAPADSRATPEGRTRSPSPSALPTVRAPRRPRPIGGATAPPATGPSAIAPGPVPGPLPLPVRLPTAKPPTVGAPRTGAPTLSPVAPLPAPGPAGGSLPGLPNAP